MEYNTEREPLLLMEYGRNVQKIVSYISELPDKELRTVHSNTLIGLMKMLNPSVRENSDNPQRIWDHLYVMSDFKLDIDGPFPMPEPHMLNKRPQPMGYNKKPPKFMNYGKNVELMIANACELPEEEREDAYIYIGRMMKSFYQSWHRETLDDAVIIQHIKEMSDGKIDLMQAWKDSDGTLLQSSNSGRVSHPHHQEQRDRNNQRKHGRPNNNRSTGSPQTNTRSAESNRSNDANNRRRKHKY